MVLYKIFILYIGFSDVLTAYHDTNLDASLRPEKYESQEKAWTKPVWGQQQQQQQQKPGKDKRRCL